MIVKSHTYLLFVMKHSPCFSPYSCLTSPISVSTCVFILTTFLKTLFGFSIRRKGFLGPRNNPYILFICCISLKMKVFELVVVTLSTRLFLYDLRTFNQTSDNINRFALDFRKDLTPPPLPLLFLYFFLMS